VARLHPAAVVGLVNELRSAVRDPGPVVVGGASALAETLRRELVAGGSPAAARVGAPERGAAAYVHVLAAAPTEEDKRTLKAANRARVPIVALLAGPGLDVRVPYVLATDVVVTPAGSGFPLHELGAAIARRVGEDATALAAALPVLRLPVCEQLTRSFARKNGILGVAVFVPGADLAVMTINELRLVLRIGAAHGLEVGADRAPEILAVVGSGFALRAVARQLLALVPIAGWLVKGAVAYAGTRAIGEAATRYFAARAAAGAESVRPRS
jgi:uncharacterized protein (DUF697 family)